MDDLHALAAVLRVDAVFGVRRSTVPPRSRAPSVPAPGPGTGPEPGRAGGRPEDQLVPQEETREP